VVAIAFGLCAAWPAAARAQAVTRVHAGGTSAGEGTLRGKTVYVSAGHGWYYSDPLGRWTTQRGVTNGLVEDFISAETVSQELIVDLERMGAYVVPVRESGMQPAMDVVDDGDPGFDQGTAATTPAAAGWGHPPEPIVDDLDPFGAGGSQVAPTGPGAAATWTFDVPADGMYTVYASWVADPGRDPAATYQVIHAGGSATFVVDQRVHGGTWVRLGRFPFVAGHDPLRGAVTLSAGTAGATLSFDAVRIGGGTSHFGRGPMLETSGRPAYEDCARYAAQWNGAPASVWDYSTSGDDQDDVGARSRFTAWDHPDGEDAVYVAWHTNAPNPARGTTSFVYGPSSYGPPGDFTGAPGSLELMDAIHTRLIADLRADWDPAWQDRGEHSAYFGEVNPANNPETPATLIEVAFHDTPADADALREPAFRKLAARAIARGIAAYFATKDGRALVLPPAPPTAPRVIDGGGQRVLAWNPPSRDGDGGDPPTGYRVYRSADGHAFDDGTVVDAAAGTRLAIDDADPAPVYFRVASINDGGESPPTEVVGAAPGPGTLAPVLVVAGYDALDATLLFHEDLTAEGLDVVDRAWEDRINDGTYAARHGAAIVAAGRGFDVVSRAALDPIDLTSYAAVDWLAGRDATPWTAGEQARLADFVAAGGRVIVSGTDLARTADPAALAPLGAGFSAEETATAADGAAPFDGLSLTLGGTGWGDYDPAAPDVLAPGPGASVAFAYAGGATAATWVPGRALVLGFPFEAIDGADTRAEVMRRALDGLGVPGGDDGGARAGCGCQGGGAPGAPLVVLVVAGLVRPRRRRRTAA
jgi:uncharacterized protein (TIGR03382 family)